MLTLLAVALSLWPAQLTPTAAATTGPDAPILVRDRTWIVRGGPTFVYGRPGDVQLMGDWDADGIATPGVFRDGRWYLRNRLAEGTADISFAYGRAGDVPVVGDWNGDGRTTIGVVRGTRWHLRNANAGGNADITFGYARRGDVPVTGDWNADGRTGIGVVRGRTWYLRNTLSTGTAQLSLAYGRPGDRPVTGDWNADGRTGIGMVRGRTWYLRNTLSTGTAASTLVFGNCGDGALSTGSARTAPGVPVSMRGTEWTRLPTTERVVALTFDAGANADGLASILGTLERTQTPGTFFLTGRWTTSYPTLARQVSAAHPVGNHTDTHPDLTTLTTTAARDEIIRAHELIRATTGREPRPWFRFPFGARNAGTIEAANCLNYGSVRWTVDTLGWKGTSEGQSTATVTQRVLANLGPGTIVLMHVGSHPRDGSTLDAAALPEVIRQVEARGYRFVDLDQYR